MNLKQCLNEMTQVAIESGNKIMNYYGVVTEGDKDISGLQSVRASSDSTLAAEKSAVCSLDFEIQREIMTFLAERYPFCGIHCEESDMEIARIAENFNHRGCLPDGKYTFLLDPIDGTRNFLNTNPANLGKGGDPTKKDYFGIGIHLALGREIVAGLFYFPAFKKKVTTAKNNGTFLNKQRVLLQAKPLATLNDPVRISKTLPGWQHSFQNDISYGSSSGVLLALLTQEIYAYVVQEVDLLDFGCSALAYREAGGFVGNRESKSLNETSLLRFLKDEKDQSVILLRGFMALTPTQEYCRSLVELIAGK